MADTHGAPRPHVPSRVRVVLHATDPRTLLSLLEGQGFDLVNCAGGRSLLEEVVQRRPAAVVYVMGDERSEDLGVLLLLRRAVPDLPLVLLATEDSLAGERQLRDLRPIYYGVMPVDAAELTAAVEAAVARTGRAG